MIRCFPMRFSNDTCIFYFEVIIFYKNVINTLSIYVKRPMDPYSMYNYSLILLYNTLYEIHIT